MERALNLPRVGVAMQKPRPIGHEPHPFLVFPGFPLVFPPFCCQCTGLNTFALVYQWKNQAIYSPVPTQCHSPMLSQKLATVEAGLEHLSTPFCLQLACFVFGNLAGIWPYEQQQITVLKPLFMHIEKNGPNSSCTLHMANCGKSAKSWGPLALRKLCSYERGQKITSTYSNRLCVLQMLPIRKY